MGVWGRSPRRYQPPSGSGVAHVSPTRPALQPTAITTRLVWCPRRSWCSWLFAPVPAPRLIGRFSGAWNWPLWHRLYRQDCAGNGSPFDRSPSSVPSREVHERSTAGTSQVSKRSAETGAHRPAGSRLIRGRSLHSAAHPQTRQARPAARRGQSKAIPRYQRIPMGHGWVRLSIHQLSSRSLTGSSPRTASYRNQGASDSVNRPLPLPRPERSPQMRHRAGSMIADAVRYMSVHSWKQPDSHGHSGTSQLQKQQPARRGIPSSRAVSAGSGRCWVRTSVG
jgi:hypothetical protein